MVTMKRILLLFILLHLYYVFNGQYIAVVPTQANINIGESVELNALGALYYYWSPNYGLSNCFGSTTVASPVTSTTYTVTGCELSSEELVLNGDFESGNVGFTSDYTYVTGMNMAYGTYTIDTDGSLVWWDGGGGHIYGCGGSGFFMLVDGATTPNQVVWEQTIDVTPNSYYAFSAQVVSMFWSYLVGEQALLQFCINGVPIGDIFHSPDVLNIWVQYYELWFSGNATTATLTILNQNTDSAGNDFGLDDISFRRLESVGEAQSTINVQMSDIYLPDNIDTANCVLSPSATEWAIAQPIISSSMVLTVTTPMVGDIDDDGQQEILLPDGNYKMIVFRADGTIKKLFPIAGMSNGPVGVIGMAKIKWFNDEYKCIIVILGSDKYLYAYDANGVQLWQSSQPFSSYNGESSPLPTISFADFNNDGWVEIYVGAEIYDASSGLFLCKANGNKGYAGRTWTTQANPYQTIAADLCGDSNLELAIGNTVYAVNIQSHTNASLNLVSVARQIPNQLMVMEDNTAIPFTDGNTTLVDINKDGHLDVLVMNVDQYNRIIYCYIWDVENQTIICSRKITNARKFGCPQIGDLDSDGNAEICFIVGTYEDHNTGANDLIYALKYNESNTNGVMDIFWTTPHNDDSGCTGLTLFDFNQDGYSELVYRDTERMRIINGSLIHHQTGSHTSQPYDLASYPCICSTQIEYPIVVDVDLDGEAEIIVGGGNQNEWINYGHLYIFNAADNSWAPARKVWNQYMYNVTNVNKDLTIPNFVFNNATPFTDPEGVVRRPFNNFLQQATTLDQYGRPYTAAADASLNGIEIENNDESILLKATYSNDGDNTLFAPYSITAFANEYGGNILKTQTVTTPLQLDETTTQYISLDKNDICGNNNLNSIFVAINCSGIGIAQNGGHQPECDTINNLFSIEITALADTIYLYENTCEPFVWYGNELTQTGDYEHVLTNIYGCDSILLLHLNMNTIDTLFVSANACDHYEWYGNTYLNSGIYNHIVHNEEDCDSIINLNLTINDLPDLEIHGLTQIAISSDLWPGIYSYCLADSTELHQCDITWTCSNPDWIVLPSNNPYWFTLIARTLGSGTLTAMADCDSDCDAMTSIEINASYFDIDEIDEIPISIYPNPANYRLIIKGKQLKSINIYDGYGQTLNVIQMNLEDEVLVDTKNMANGLYIVR